MKVLTKGFYRSDYSDLIVHVVSVRKYKQDTVKAKMSIMDTRGRLISRHKWYELEEDRIDHWIKLRVNDLFNLEM